LHGDGHRSKSHLILSFSWWKKSHQQKNFAQLIRAIKRDTGKWRCQKLHSKLANLQTQKLRNPTILNLQESSMMKDFTCAVVAAFALLLADSSSALPVTRRSSSATETGSSRSGSSSGSASGSGDDCDRELSASNQETLISNIDSLLAGLETTLREVRVSGWQLVRKFIFSAV
jgi:hypothetical protein